MSADLRLRIAPLEWALRSGRGEATALDWVDTALLARGRAFTVVGEAEAPAFRHVPYGAFLPRPMLEAAQEARERGEPTLLEALLLLFARVEWLVTARRWLFTTSSPVPPLLVGLVEAYGIPRELHRAEPAVLATLLPRLPGWYPHRGDPERALALLEPALGEPLPVEVARHVGEEVDEAFACHAASWWRERGDGHGALAIRDGVAVLVPTGATRSDVPLRWRVPTAPDAPGGGARFPGELLRLLPVWATVRLHSETLS